MRGNKKNATTDSVNIISRMPPAPLMILLTGRVEEMRSRAEKCANPCRGGSDCAETPSQVAINFQLPSTEGHLKTRCFLGDTLVKWESSDTEGNLMNNGKSPTRARTRTAALIEPEK